MLYKRRYKKILDVLASIVHLLQSMKNKYICNNRLEERLILSEIYIFYNIKMLTKRFKLIEWPAISFFPLSSSFTLLFWWCHFSVALSRKCISLLALEPLSRFDLNYFFLRFRNFTFNCAVCTMQFQAVCQTIYVFHFSLFKVVESVFRKKKRVAK